ncbi:MAG: hypothetical protein ACOX4M_04400 [Acetivibrionales bacterium]|jgi:hypothetical protein
MISADRIGGQGGLRFEILRKNGYRVFVLVKLERGTPEEYP